MPFKVNNKQFLENTIKYGKKIEKLMQIDFESKSADVDDNKYIKTKKYIRRQYGYKFS